MPSKLNQIQGTSYERCHIQQISTLTSCFPMHFRVRYISTVHVVSAIAFQSKRIQPCTVTNYKPKQTIKQTKQLAHHSQDTYIDTYRVHMCDIQIHTFDISYIPKGTAKCNRNVLKCGFRKTANQRQTKQHTFTEKERGGRHGRNS